MANTFSKEEYERLKEELINLGFDLLRKGGIKAVNIDVLTTKCFIAKGTFYHFFSSKSDFLYAVMKRKREQTKEKINDFLDENQTLTYQKLYAYLQWMCQENPNIFSYLNSQETKWLLSKWPLEYLENENNDEKTAKWLISYLSTPKKLPNWQLFCNFLKLASWSLNSQEFLIQDSYQQTIDILLKNACDAISE